jgi:phage host-nuclease inhibitor protein Gam
MPDARAMHDASKQATSLQKTIADLQDYRQRLYSERNKHTAAIEGKKKAATDDINLATADLGKQ